MNVSLCSKFQDLLCSKIDAGRNASEHDRSRIVHVSFHHVPHELDVRLSSHALGGALEDPWNVDDTEMLLFRARDFQT
ncbi:dynamin GTPase [Pyrenophora tritici-repentis]|nr:Interferon-induced GTP-binding protein mx2 [Pyrenophora tritici-repentis]KAI1524957.1 dynamin GTPase [Pyrenophora tritici-repentis]